MDEKHEEAPHSLRKRLTAVTERRVKQLSDRARALFFPQLLNVAHTRDV